MYTPSSVSKLLPAVEIVTVPVAGACQFHQTDLPPALPACTGSRVSLVPPTLLVETEIVVPLRVMLLAKSLFTGTEVETVRNAALDETVLRVPLMEFVATTTYVPASTAWTVANDRLLVVAPGTAVPFLNHCSVGEGVPVATTDMLTVSPMFTE